MPEYDNALIRIIDDDASLCDALRFMLRSEGWKSVAYTSGVDFFEKDDPSVPGCIILDYQMPELSGTEIQELLPRRGFVQPVLFLTAHADLDMAIHVFKAGANDLLKKPVNAAALISAVSAAVEKDAQNRSKSSGNAREKELFSQLTRREAEVLKLVSKGLMNCQVAARLGLSERTVEGHRANGYKRLGVKTLAELHLFLKKIE